MRVRRKWWYWVVLAVGAVYAAFALVSWVGPLPQQRESRVEGNCLVTRTQTRSHKLLSPSQWGFSQSRGMIPCGAIGATYEQKQWRVGFFEVIDMHRTAYRPLDEHTQQPAP